MKLKRYLLITSLLISGAAVAQYTNWNHSSYNIVFTNKVLERTLFYSPAYGAVYRAKFEALLQQNDPRIRGVVVHNHGCSGMWGWEEHVANFYWRLNGLAVITPEFVTRPGNKTGCPGGSNDEVLNGGETADRFREGIFTARNVARMDARVADVAAVVDYIKTLTDKPIILSGHSEGARTVYRWSKKDSRIIGFILHNQSCSKNYDHLWQMPTHLPVWHVLESRDPFAEDAYKGSCEHHFNGESRKNLTFLFQDGSNHNPLTMSR
jgi:dienelactone hydrolase